MGLLPWPMIMCFVHIFFMLLFYFYSIIYFNILFYFFRPHKIRLRLSEDAAGASTSKKSCRRPQSRRTEQEKFMENPKRRNTRHKKVLSQQRNQVPSHQRKCPRSKHGEIERKKKVQEDTQKSMMRKSFTADCTD